MSEQKQKFLSTLIVSVGAFLGFEALSFIVGIYQIKAYLQLSVYIYLFHVLWLTFLFDLHFRNRGVLATARLNKQGVQMFKQAFKDRLQHVFQWNYLRHYQNYLVLPAIIYWATVVLLFLNPFKPYLKQFIIVLASLILTVAYWYFKDFFSRKMETHELGLKILAGVKLLAAFLIYASIIGITRYFDLGQEFLFLTSFAMTFLLVYQALFQHRLLDLVAYAWIMILALIVSLASLFVYYYWDSNYITGSLIMLAVYNTAWAMLHHHLEHNLTKKLAMEYLLVMIVALSLLLASHNFTTRINSI